MKVGLHELDHSGPLCVAQYAARATEGEEKEHFIWRQRRPLVCLRQCDWRRIERRISRKFFSTNGVKGEWGGGGVVDPYKWLR